MPRVRDLIDYNDDAAFRGRKPHETIVEVPPNDSVKVITVYLQPNEFVQVKRIVDDDGERWSVATNIDTIITRDDAKAIRKK